MNNETNIFEGIPSLADEQGLANYIAQQNQPVQQNQIPAMLQQQPQQPAAGNAPEQNPGNSGVPGYTPEQINAIIKQNQELMARINQPAANPAVNPAQVNPQNINTPNTQGAYSPQVRAQIVELVNRGVPLETILSALNGNRQNNETMQRITAVEQYLQQQEYIQQQNAFIEKMTAFGDKFGLSEDELVTFANTAMSKGINVAQVTDVEAVFRAVYPQQYAIRAQRLQGVSSPQIYGGVSVQETPRAATSKMEDMYVEDFLKGAMPNQYRQK